MPYHLDQFIADCSAILTRDPGPKEREEVRVRLERLLSNADFVRQCCGDDVPQGLKTLYEDPKLGFQILAHINDKARAGQPHDHGASWAIYGQATKYTEMTEWERVDDGRDPKHAKLKQVKKYRLMPGHADARTASAHFRCRRLLRGQLVPLVASYQPQIPVLCDGPTWRPLFRCLYVVRVADDFG